MKKFEAWLSAVLLFTMTSSMFGQAPKPKIEKPVKNGPAILYAEPQKDDPKDDELHKLLKARYNAALGEVQGMYHLYQAGRSSLELLPDAGHRLVLSGLELCETPAEKIELLSQVVELYKGVESLAQARYQAARGTEVDIHRTRYHRLDAEIQLLRVKTEAANEKKK